MITILMSWSESVMDTCAGSLLGLSPDLAVLLVAVKDLSEAADGLPMGINVMGILPSLSAVSSPASHFPEDPRNVANVPKYCDEAVDVFLSARRSTSWNSSFSSKDSLLELDFTRRIIC